MSWKRSFDLCTANRPKPPIPMHYRAYRDSYIEISLSDYANWNPRILPMTSPRSSESHRAKSYHLALRAEPAKVLKSLQEGYGRKKGARPGGLALGRGAKSVLR